MNVEIIDNSLDQNPDRSPVQSALAWWEKRRIWFNLTVGIAGVIPIVLYADHFNIFDFVALIIYAIVANVFYSTGFILEALNQHYLKGRFNFEYLRVLLFVAGTVFSAFLTYFLTLVYYWAS